MFRLSKERRHNSILRAYDNSIAAVKKAKSRTKRIDLHLDFIDELCAWEDGCTNNHKTCNNLYICYCEPPLKPKPKKEDNNVKK